MSVGERTRLLRKRGHRERILLRNVGLRSAFWKDEDWKIKVDRLRQFERAAGRRCVRGEDCVCRAV